MNTEIQLENAAALKQLPAHSRVWVFALAQTLSEEQAASLGAQVKAFLASWDSHGAQVAGSYAISHGRFLLVAADQDTCSVSGCSIDSLYRAVQEMLASNALQVANVSDVFFLEDNVVQQVSRAEFKALAAEGKVRADTLVFDTSIQNLASVYDEKWILPRSDSWHEKLL